MVITQELIAGVDEAGRGPLAGPVVAAAVIFPAGFDAAGIDDSKKLTPEKRVELAIRIKAETIWTIEFAEVDEIDRLNILWATMAAMSRALDRLSSRPTGALIDGNRLPKTMPCPCEAIIDGDAIHPVIGAASILAKTARDAHMRTLALIYPLYNFEKNFGYPTPDHLAALREYGPCPAHRMSFAPCRPDVQPCLDFEN